ncbi:ATP-binding protein [Streptomyces sp. 3MP-14]|uniref:ATP-binding protein n=1 Tax=Streptomyces mimosae TaxID=2586635 RepID=A0A5N6ACB8_9ACTN|nr:MULTISPECIES: ATP-binding protein [Streptomyces]KAB8166301.1 ATP-binding protein [Streptomyces mimosae]KAB8174094.1 ATP-binding protein [Streptomyces sp. 3MP-14]
MASRPVFPVFSRGLLADPRWVETWRRTAGQLLTEWGASTAAVELVRLGVTELVTNVSRHVDDPRCGLRISRAGDDVLVEVWDRSARPPVVGETPDWTAECGRGLWLLREMADDFGYMPRPFTLRVGCRGTVVRMGKTVWFSCKAVRPEKTN